MSASKRPASASSVPSTKQAVTVSTVEKWIRENHRSMQTMIWLKLKKCLENDGHVENLLCLVCQEFDDRLRIEKLQSAFVMGATNLRCSNFKDHAKTEMHSTAMSLYCQKTTASSISEAPIVRALQYPSAEYDEKVS